MTTGNTSAVPRQETGWLFFVQQEFFFPRNLLCGIFFTFSMLCGIFFSLLTSLQDFLPQKRSVQVFVKMYLHSQTGVFTLWLLQ